jgi:YidC/Oxa1 family membrane protein insertase
MLIIDPLYQIIEFVYLVFFNICNNVGISVIGVSIAVTLFCLPLYAVAEHWQEVERNTQKALKPGIDRIKKGFRGDEQYMMLNTYYKQNHYHPIMALRSSFGLLIQIPFFIAAYKYLSTNSALAGRSFLFIGNMGSQDALFHIGSFPVNVLPIAMTIINIIAGAIYTKGFPVKEKVQIYGMAVIFLVILYASPAGLVLYWTMNNVFSLVKNIFYKLKKPLFVFWIMMSAVLLLADVYVMYKFHDFKAVPVVALSVLVFCAPLIVRVANYFISTVLAVFVDSFKTRTFFFIISAVCIAVLTGIIIPSFLMTSSTVEYSYIDSYKNPAFFLYNGALQSFGLFVVWPVAMYFLFGKKVQSGLAAFFFAALLIALIDNFGFQGNYGVVTPDLVFTEHKSFKPSMIEFLINSALILAVLVVVAVLFWKKISIAYNALLVLTGVSLFGVSVYNNIVIQKNFRSIERKDLQVENLAPIAQFSKTGKNVVVFMLDRAAGYLLKDAFDDYPKLYDDFTGFTFYPNTVSFGSWTIQGAPGLFGGYEYTPWSMNHRRELPMQKKHNESISMLPFMFEKAGFTCNVVDPPYPNYDTVPIYGFYDGHKDVHAHAARATYRDLWYKVNNYKQLPIKSSHIKRNMIRFAIFKIVPPILRSAVHYQYWWAPRNDLQTNSDFIDCYSVLDFLPELTDVNSQKDGFFMIDSEASHDTAFCQAPDYVPVENVTNFGTSRWAHDQGYHGTVASLRAVGEWLEYLKKNGVYDNTRIIFVADHGSAERVPEVFDTEDHLPRTREWFNPLLMVKDFNATGRIKTDMTFMTNADTPAIAADGVVKDPVNCFTGKPVVPLTSEQKNEQCIISMSMANAVRTTVNNGLRIKDTDWYNVRDSIFDIHNWKHLNVVNGDMVK